MGEISKRFQYSSSACAKVDSSAKPAVPAIPLKVWIARNAVSLIGPGFGVLKRTISSCSAARRCCASVTKISNKPVDRCTCPTEISSISLSSEGDAVCSANVSDTGLPIGASGTVKRASNDSITSRGSIASGSSIVSSGSIKSKCSIALNGSFISRGSRVSSGSIASESSTTSSDLNASNDSSASMGSIISSGSNPEFPNSGAVKASSTGSSSCTIATGIAAMPLVSSVTASDTAIEPNVASATGVFGVISIFCGAAG